jgi:hypothetical protein
MNIHDLFDTLIPERLPTIKPPETKLLLRTTVQEQRTVIMGLIAVILVLAVGLFAYSRSLSDSIAASCMREKRMVVDEMHFRCELVVPQETRDVQVALVRGRTF